MPTKFVYKTKEQLSTDKVDTSNVKGSTLPAGMLYDDTTKTLAVLTSDDKLGSKDTTAISKKAQSAIDELQDDPSNDVTWANCEAGSTLVHYDEATGIETIFHKV